MKETRKYKIKDIVLKTDDLERLALEIEAQKENPDSGDHISLEYEVRYADETERMSDSRIIISDDALNSYPARPTTVKITFNNYTKEQSIYFDVTHGDDTYRNELSVTGPEAWVRSVFSLLKQHLDSSEPQNNVFRKHKTLLLNLIAFGIGSLGLLVISLILRTLVFFVGDPIPQQLIPNDHQLLALAPAIHVSTWMWRWLVGFFWGAFAVREWLLSLWPSVEFAFGPSHLRTESEKRKRVSAVVSLIVLPVIISLIADYIA